MGPGLVEDGCFPPDNGGVATGQSDEVPTGREAAIDRIQAMRATIRPARESTRGATRREDTTSHADERSPSAEQSRSDLEVDLAQRDATIAALRVEIAMLRAEVADIVERLTALSARADEACGDD